MRKQPEPKVTENSWSWYLVHSDTFLNVVKLGGSFYCQRVEGVICLADFKGSYEVWFDRAVTLQEGIDKTLAAYHEGLKRTHEKSGVL